MALVKSLKGVTRERTWVLKTYLKI
jgi:hypothetical protein